MDTITNINSVQNTFYSSAIKMKQNVLNIWKTELLGLFVHLFSSTETRKIL